MSDADHRLIAASVAEQTAALLEVVDQHERDLGHAADRLVLEVDGQWTAELSGHTEAVRVRLGSRARSVSLRDEQGALRAFLMIDELDVSGEVGASVRRFDHGRIGLVLRRRPGGLELEVRTQGRGSEQPSGAVAAGMVLGDFEAASVDGTLEPHESASREPHVGRNGPAAVPPPPPLADAASSGAATLHSPPMLEDELGGQVSAVRPAEEDAMGPGRLLALPVARRRRRLAVAGPSRLGRLLLTAAVVGAATLGVLWYQQHRFERQIAADQADRKRLELARERLEREKAEIESRIAGLRDDLRLAKDAAERARLEAEIDRERAKVDRTRAGDPLGAGVAADPTLPCKRGEPGCVVP